MAGIWHDEDAGAWLIEMRSTSYAFGLAGWTRSGPRTTPTRGAVRDYGSALIQLTRLPR